MFKAQGQHLYLRAYVRKLLCTAWRLPNKCLLHHLILSYFPLKGGRLKSHIGWWWWLLGWLQSHSHESSLEGCLEMALADKLKAAIVLLLSILFLPNLLHSRPLPLLSVPLAHIGTYYHRRVACKAISHTSTAKAQVESTFHFLEEIWLALRGHVLRTWLHTSIHTYTRTVRMCTYMCPSQVRTHACMHIHTYIKNVCMWLWWVSSIRLQSLEKKTHFSIQ